MPSNAIECFGEQALLNCVKAYQNWTSKSVCTNAVRWTFWLRSFNVEEGWSQDKSLTLPYLVLLHSQEAVHSLASTSGGRLDDPFDGRFQRLVAGVNGEEHGQILAPVVNLAFSDPESPDVAVVRATCYMSRQQLDRFLERQKQLRTDKTERSIVYCEKVARAALKYPTFKGFGGQVRDMEDGDVQVQILLPVSKFEPRFLDPLALPFFNEGVRSLPLDLPEAVKTILVS